MTGEKKYIEIGPFVNWMQMQRVPKHKISYIEHGDSENPNVIVCAHGLTRNAHDFDKLAGALKDKFRIIAISYPGRGDSDYFANKKHYNYQVYVKESLLFLKKMGIDRPIWIGTSMGGLIGMAMASLKKDIFKAMILNDIGPYMRAEVLVKIRKYAGQSTSFESFSRAKEHLKLIYAGFGILDEEDWDDMTKHSFEVREEGRYYMRYDPEIIGGIQVKAEAPKDVNLWAMWKKISCPLMVVHGIKSDILELSTVNEMKKTKDFHLHTVHYAGHAPALVTEDQIEAIKTWVNQVL